MRVNRNRPAGRDFVFGQLMPHFASDGGEGGGAGGDFDPEVAKAKLKEAGFVVMTQEALNGMLAKERKTEKTKLQEEIDSNAEKIETLQAELENARQKKADDKDSVSKVEMERLLGIERTKAEKALERSKQLEKSKIENAIIQEAIKAGAVKGSHADIAAMLASQITLTEDGDFKIVDAQGQGRTGKEGFMKLEELVSDYLSQKPYLKEPSGNAGASSQGSQGVANGNGKPLDLEKLSQMSMDDYASAGGLTGQLKTSSN